MSGTLHRFRALVRHLLDRSSLERDMDVEFQSHIAHRADDLERRGMSRESAERTARIEFGSVAWHKDAARAARGVRVIDEVRAAISFAWRGIAQRPLQPVAIVLTLTLGIGVNAALFTVVDRVYFQAPSGVRDPGSVRRLVWHHRGFQNSEYTQEHFSVRDHAALTDAARGLADVEGYDVVRDREVGPERDRRNVGYATSGYFRLAGVAPFRGRFFTADENRYGEPRNVIVLGHSYWRKQFGGSADVLGRTIRVDSALFTIVGIMPPDFGGMDVDVVDLWAPLAALPPTREGPWWTGEFDILQLFVRANDADALQLVERRLPAAFRAGHAGSLARDSTVRPRVVPLLRARSAPRVASQPDRELTLLVRLAAVALIVFIIAVSNAASLLLVRTLRRRREFAVRLALGSSRARLIWHCTTESVLVALAGGAAALLVAWWTGSALRRLLLSDIHWTETVVDHRVVLLAFALALVAGVFAGAVPAMVALRGDLTLALKTGGQLSGRARTPLRGSLLVLQTSLCVTLLATAGLFVQSLRNAAVLDLGCDADRLITFNWSGANEALVTTTVARIRALPGVSAVSRSAGGVGSGLIASVYFPSGDSITGLDGPMTASVDTAYARTLGLRLLRGRFFTAPDVEHSEPVIVINSALAGRYWPQRDPIGDCIYVGSRHDAPCRRVIGVVRGVRRQIIEEPPPVVYMPVTQSPFRCCFNYINIRTAGTATSATVASIRNILAPLPSDARFPPEPTRMIDRIAPQLRPWRIGAAMFVAFGALALAAAMAGIYGLVAYEVADRMHELGVRITLGASAAAVVRLVVGSGVRLVAIGIASGTIIAVLSGTSFAGLLFETAFFDVRWLALAALAVVIAAVAASLLPAWRATRLDPATVLRAV